MLEGHPDCALCDVVPHNETEAVSRQVHLVLRIKFAGKQ